MYYAHGFEEKNTKIAQVRTRKWKEIPKIRYVILNVFIRFSSNIQLMLYHKMIVFNYSQIDFWIVIDDVGVVQKLRGQDEVGRSPVL